MCDGVDVAGLASLCHNIHVAGDSARRFTDMELLFWLTVKLQHSAAAALDTMRSVTRSGGAGGKNMLNMPSDRALRRAANRMDLGADDYSRDAAARRQKQERWLAGRTAESVPSQHKKAKCPRRWLCERSQKGARAIRRRRCKGNKLIGTF